MGWIDGGREQIAFCWARPPSRWTLVWPPVLHHLLRAAGQPNFGLHRSLGQQPPFPSFREIDDNPSIYPRRFPNLLIDSPAVWHRSGTSVLCSSYLRPNSQRSYPFSPSCGHASETCTSHPPSRELGLDPSSNTATSQMRSHNCGCLPKQRSFIPPGDLGVEPESMEAWHDAGEMDALLIRHACAVDANLNEDNRGSCPRPCAANGSALYQRSQRVMGLYSVYIRTNSNVLFRRNLGIQAHTRTHRQISSGRSSRC